MSNVQNIECIHFPTIGSTNTWAKENAARLARDKITLITADCQTAGRGRFKRIWISPFGQNIYATFCLFVNNDRMNIGNLPQILALSVADILSDLGFAPRLKWPNDVLLSGKKVAGILCETTLVEDKLCVILGIGLNVNMPLELLQTIDRPATSLLAERGEPLDKEYVFRQLKKIFFEKLESFLLDGFVNFYISYCNYSFYQKGDLIGFSNDRVVEYGKFESIVPDGSLEVRFKDGQTKRLYSGEILFPAK